MKGKYNAMANVHNSKSIQKNASPKKGISFMGKAKVLEYRKIYNAKINILFKSSTSTTPLACGTMKLKRPRRRYLKESRLPCNL